MSVLFIMGSHGVVIMEAIGVFVKEKGRDLVHIIYYHIASRKFSIAGNFQGQYILLFLQILLLPQK